MNTTRAGTERELFLDQEAQRVKCASCGQPLTPEHGTITISSDPPRGVNWWQCMNPECGRRVKEEYRLEDNMIVSTAIEEV